MWMEMVRRAVGSSWGLAAVVGFAVGCGDCSPGGGSCPDLSGTPCTSRDDCCEFCEQGPSCYKPEPGCPGVCRDPDPGSTGYDASTGTSSTATSEPDPSVTYTGPSTGTTDATATETDTSTGTSTGTATSTGTSTGTGP